MNSDLLLKVGSDQDDPVDLEGERLAELVGSRNSRSLDLLEGDTAVHTDSDVVEPLTEHRALERLIADQGDLIIQGDQLDIEPFEREELGHPAAMK